MVCYAERYNQTEPARGTSGISPFCVAALAGFFIGGCVMKKYKTSKKQRTNALIRYYANKKRLRAYARTYYRANKKRLCKSICAYFQTKKGKLVQKRAQQKYRIGNPNKIKARNAVNKAVKIGKLPHPNNCVCKCGERAKQYHHYLGYISKYQLDVIPICKKCHGEIDRKSA